MALQWMILAYVVAAEAAVAIILTLPSPKAVKSRVSSIISHILQPSLFIIPFAAFQLLDIYWKNEHRLMCKGETCTAIERDRYERSVISFSCFSWISFVDWVTMLGQSCFFHGNDSSAILFLPDASIDVF
ncbi:hypothetical protein ACS0TY_031078 [Phlomoides rotata]